MLTYAMLTYADVAPKPHTHRIRDSSETQCEQRDSLLSHIVASDVSIRQHTSAYVSIRQHTSAYVSIRQHTSVARLATISHRSEAQCETTNQLLRKNKLEKVFLLGAGTMPALLLRVRS
jgi:isocitrate/isopropylmalate dehydrogenase